MIELIEKLLALDTLGDVHLAVGRRVGASYRERYDDAQPGQDDSDRVHNDALLHGL